MLSQTTVRHGWTLLSYCLMTNHYHLIVRVDQGGLSSGMQRLNTAFARTMNSDTIGSATSSRTASTAIDRDGSASSAAVKYVARNPVDAGVCDTSATGHGAATVRWRVPSSR